MRTILAVAMILVLAAPGIAVADKKKSPPAGKDTPTESVGFNYEGTGIYTSRSTTKSGVSTGGATAKSGRMRH